MTEGQILLFKGLFIKLRTRPSKSDCPKIFTNYLLREEKKNDESLMKVYIEKQEFFKKIWRQSLSFGSRDS